MAFENEQNPFAGLNQEQLGWVKQQLAAVEGPGQQAAPGTTTVKLPDGRQVTGTGEQIAQAFQEYAQQSAQRAPEPQGQVVQRQEFNQKHFEQALLKDGREGFKYLTDQVYGFDPAQVIPVLAKEVIGLRQQADELLEVRFRQGHQTLNDQDFQAVKGFIKEQGWAPNSKSFENAYVILKAGGAIEKAPQGQQGPRVFTPGRTVGENPAAPFYSQGGQQGTLPAAYQQPNVYGPVGGSAGPSQLSNGEMSYDEVYAATRGFSKDELRQVLERTYQETQGQGR